MKTFNLPQINTNDINVEVVQWHVESGAIVAAGDDLVDLGTSKAVVTVSAELGGYAYPLIAKGEAGKVGAPFVVIAETPLKDPQRNLAVAQSKRLSVSPAPEPTAERPVGAAVSGPYAFTRFTPAAEALLLKHGVQLESWQGLGLVTSNIAREQLGLAGAREPHRSGHQRQERRAGPIGAAAPMPMGLRSERCSVMKRAEIDALTLGREGGLSCTLTFTYQAGRLKQRLEADGLFDGMVLPVLLFELAQLVKSQPIFASFYQDGAIHFYDRVDIGLAIDMGKGLKVVNLAQTDRLLPQDIYQRVLDATQRYLGNQLAVEELSGASITVTDLSALGVASFQPLINGRQSVMVGLGWDQNQAGHLLTLNMTFDHRVLTGREVAMFVNEWKKRLDSYDLGASEMMSELIVADFAGGNEERALMEDVCCTRCGIDVRSHYREYRGDAMMHVGVGADGELIYTCQVCATGY